MCCAFLPLFSVGLPLHQPWLQRLSPSGKPVIRCTWSWSLKDLFDACAGITLCICSRRKLWSRRHPKEFDSSASSWEKICTRRGLTFVPVSADCDCGCGCSDLRWETPLLPMVLSGHQRLQRHLDPRSRLLALLLRRLQYQDEQSFSNNFPVEWGANAPSSSEDI